MCLILSVVASSAAKTSPNEFRILLDFLLKILPLAGWIFSVFVWWDATGKKRYAAQRAFEQIEQNIELLKNNQAEIVKLIERHESNTFKNYTDVTNRIFRDLDSIKLLVNNLTMYLNSGVSSGFFNKKGGDEG